MPLIRYRLNDTLRVIDRASPYGPYPVIAPLVGREEWVPQFRNALGQGEFLSASAIEEASVPGVWRFQLRCKDETSFRFAVCLDSGIEATQRAPIVQAVQERLREILNKKGLSNVAFAVDVVEDIAVNPVTRKFQLVLPPPRVS
jgi:phenylacetate-coenzyme A ligase PaaK-like adenylate-forming protein